MAIDPPNFTGEVTLPVELLARVYYAVIRLPYPLGDDLSEAIEDLSRAVAGARK